MGIYEDTMKEVNKIDDPKVKANITKIVEDTLRDEGYDIPKSGATEKVEKSYEIVSLDEFWKGKVYDPGAVAAAIGRKKYGKEKFQEMAAKGRSRKKAPKGKAKMAPGGGGRFAKLEREIASKNK